MHFRGSDAGAGRRTARHPNAFSLEPTAIGPEGLAQLMKSDYDKWRRVVREANIKVE
jgi:tripartite-type tricarboxylate transporter receptor subunit TctC